ncbi:hypothetical protein ACHAXR_003911 [Thalassiosira sp. AJA248-18]
MTMIIGTTLRQGRCLASKRPAVLIGGVRNFCSVDATTTTTAWQQQQPARSTSAASSTTSWRPTPSHHYQPPIHLLHHSYHTSSPTLKTDAAKVKPDTSDEPHQTPFRALTPSIRDTIVADLRSVDADNNGRIDADELKVLLRKHNDAFTESEILELSELFYTSLGASAVDINRFLEALDAAAAEKGTSGGGETANGEVSPLAMKGKFKTHPLGIGTCASEYMFTKTHGRYTEEDLNIELTHVPPVTFSDKSALFAVRCVRLVFDTATLWNIGSVTKSKILNRAIFLETIAAIPGMVAAIIRHFRSLRNMARDGGMLNMFLEEANNERMHLLTFIRMKEPGYIFRAAVIGAQFGFGSFFLTAYMVNPTWCHRFIGYIEEEACHTYTKILDEMDKAPIHSELDEWKKADAPKIAKGYWHLGEEGTVYDVMKAVRADEAEHRDVNHAVSGVADDTVNPLFDPREKLDGMLKKYVKDIMEKEAKKQACVARD